MFEKNVAKDIFFQPIFYDPDGLIIITLPADFYGFRGCRNIRHISDKSGEHTFPRGGDKVPEWKGETHLDSARYGGNAWPG